MSFPCLLPFLFRLIFLKRDLNVVTSWESTLNSTIPFFHKGIEPGGLDVYFRKIPSRNWTTTFAHKTTIFDLNWPKSIRFPLIGKTPTCPSLSLSLFSYVVSYRPVVCSPGLTPLFNNTWFGTPQLGLKKGVRSPKRTRSNTSNFETENPYFS